MNYTKLTLAVTAGILLAAAIIFAIIEIPEYQRQERLRRRYALMDSQACREEGCAGGAYERALKTAKSKGPDGIAVAALTFCTETAWHGATPERQAGLIAQCQRETAVHLAEDLK